MLIPLHQSEVGAEEKQAAFRVLNSQKLARGEEVSFFEAEFATYVNKKYAVAVSSGTSALHLAVRGAGWGQGDEVITTPFSYIASSNCLLYQGVTPVFADINSETGNLDPAACRSKITSRTRGILLVHLMGRPIDPEPFLTLANEFNISVIEDACQALGNPTSTFAVGSIGHSTVYSFFENKPITSGGEGGMLVTDSFTLAEQFRSWRDQGRSGQYDWINHVSLGYNYRMTELQAAIGRAQLKKLPGILEARTVIARHYTRHLRDVPGVSLPEENLVQSRSWFVYPIRFSSSALRDSVHMSLKLQGIESRCGYFPPLYSFPMYRDLDVRDQDYPDTESLYKSLLVLPVYQSLTEKLVERICDIIHTTVTEQTREESHAAVI